MVVKKYMARGLKAANHRNDFGPWFWVHVCLLVIAYASPFFVDWKIVLLAIILLQLQYSFVGGCIVNHREFGKGYDDTFYGHYLSKIFPQINKWRVKFVVRYVVPVLLLSAAYMYQVQLGNMPLFLL